MNEVEKVYQEFWKDIVEKDGQIDIEQVKRELHDYYYLMENVPMVYDHITGGRLSKPNYPASVVIAEAERHNQEWDESIKCNNCGSKDWDYE